MVDCCFYDISLKKYVNFMRVKLVELENDDPANARLEAVMPGMNQRLT